MRLRIGRAPRTSEAIGAYMLALQAGGKAPKYIDGMEWALLFLEREYPGRLPLRVDELEELFAEIQAGRKPETFDTAFTRIKRFYAWACGRYELPDPFAVPAGKGGLGRPRLRRRVLPAFTEAEVDLLLRSSQDKPRDLAALLLILDTGVRLSEAYNLAPRDLQPGFARVQGKVGERLVPLSPRTYKALTALADSEALWRTEGRRFAGRWAGRYDWPALEAELAAGVPAKEIADRNGWPHLRFEEALRMRRTRGERRQGDAGASEQALTLSGFQQVIKRAIARAGLEGGPHKLRHTFATLALKKGMDLVTVRRILGHTTVRMTERYVDQDVLSMADTHERFSPIAHLDAGDVTTLRVTGPALGDVTLRVRGAPEAWLQELTAWVEEAGGTVTRTVRA